MSTISLTTKANTYINNTPLKYIAVCVAQSNQFCLKNDLGIAKSSIVTYNFFVKDTYFHGNKSSTSMGVEYSVEYCFTTHNVEI